MKSPLFCLLWTIFGHFSYSTSINYSLTIELNYLLNWISRFFLNWIIFCIEFWAKQYWIKYWLNHILAKFKHWIESDEGEDEEDEDKDKGKSEFWIMSISNDQDLYSFNLDSPGVRCLIKCQLAIKMILMFYILLGCPLNSSIF